MWKKLRVDEYIIDDKVCRMTKEKAAMIKELDYVHLTSGRVML